jgi:hypothetical protein
VADREEQHSEFEERDTGVILQIILCTEGQLSPVEEDPTQARLCVEPTTPCASPRSEETLSIVVSKGSKDNSQNSGSSTITQLQIVSPRRNTMQNMMVGVDPTLRMFVFHGAGSEDPEQHLFICETIWTVKNV